MGVETKWPSSSGDPQVGHPQVPLGCGRLRAASIVRSHSIGFMLYVSQRVVERILASSDRMS